MVEAKAPLRGVGARKCRHQLFVVLDGCVYGHTPVAATACPLVWA
jgi:hypothetical protein